MWLLKPTSSNCRVSCAHSAQQNTYQPLMYNQTWNSTSFIIFGKSAPNWRCHEMSTPFRHVLTWQHTVQLLHGFPGSRACCFPVLASALALRVPTSWLLAFSWLCASCGGGWVADGIIANKKLIYIDGLLGYHVTKQYVKNICHEVKHDGNVCFFFSYRKHGSVACGCSWNDATFRYGDLPSVSFLQRHGRPGFDSPSRKSPPFATPTPSRTASSRHLGQDAPRKMSLKLDGQGETGMLQKTKSLQELFPLGSRGALKSNIFHHGTSQNEVGTGLPPISLDLITTSIFFRIIIQYQSRVSSFLPI